MRYFLTAALLALFIVAMPAPAPAVEVAPRITDREIVERLTTVEEAIKRLDQRFADIDKRFADIDKRFEDMNKRFEDMNQRITDMNQRITDTNQRITDLQQTIDQRFSDLQQTMLALFGSLIALIIALFGYIAWDRRTMFKPLRERLDRMEQTLERELDPDHELGSRLTRLLQIMRERAKTDPRIAEDLRSCSLL